MEIPDGWTLHCGGDRPVYDDVVVEVFTRRELVDGWTSHPEPAGYWDWTTEQDECDIIAYKVVG